uniref:Uncharacterized protein n=1 Tax=Leersia perrieri TaxID=77586 RepID=A0A0D9XUV3_9ORYZ
MAAHTATAAVARVELWVGTAQRRHAAAAVRRGTTPRLCRLGDFAATADTTPPWWVFLPFAVVDHRVRGGGRQRNVLEGIGCMVQGFATAAAGILNRDFTGDFFFPQMRGMIYIRATFHDLRFKKNRHGLYKWTIFLIFMHSYGFTAEEEIENITAIWMEGFMQRKSQPLYHHHQL